MTQNAQDFHEQLVALGTERGCGTIVDLLDVIVRDRESLTDEQALRAAKAMDWDAAWDQVVGPALDALTDMLHQALEEAGS